MTHAREPLEILLARSGQRSISKWALTALCLGLLWLSFVLAGDALDSGRPWIPVVFNMQVVLGLALPFCCAWDSRLLESVRKGRFLEATLLTGMTVEEWSDGMLRLGFRQVARVVLPVWVLGLSATAAYAWEASDLCSPHLGAAMEEAVLWLPATMLLVAVVAYFHQVRSVPDVDRPGREIVQAAVSLPILAVGACIGWAWLDLAPLSAAVVLGMSALSLLLARQVILSRLRLTISGSTGRKTVWAPATKPWSKNPIIVRESFRAARRAGGTLGFYLRRYGPLTAIAVWLVWRASIDYDYGRPVVPALPCYCLLGGLLVYGSLLPAVFSERSLTGTSADCG